MLVKEGEIYELGDHRLACGDCRNPELVKKLIGSQKIKLILTDPPYGVGYVENKKDFCQIKKDVAIENDNITSEAGYRIFTSDWLNVAKPYIAIKNSCYIFNSDRMIFALKDGMETCGFRLAQILIWIKNNQVIGRRDYLAKHELIAYGWYGTHQFYKSKDKSVLFYPKPNASPLHPTTKPLGLIRRLILNSSQIGDTIYDCFSGSGNVLIAAEQTGRKCLAIEIDPDYCKTVINRFKKLKGEK
jgi:DNA modification methylase